MKVKKVFKYGTGDIIPEGAIYLCTKVEQDVIYSGRFPSDYKTKNEFVWHYFLVEVDDEP